MAIMRKAGLLVSVIPWLVTIDPLAAMAQDYVVTYEPNKVMYAQKRSNVRAGPGTSYGKVGLLEVGESVRVTAKSRRWFKLESRPGQQERFVYDRLLTLVRPESAPESTRRMSVRTPLMPVGPTKANGATDFVTDGVGRLMAPVIGVMKAPGTRTRSMAEAHS